MRRSRTWSSLLRGLWQTADDNTENLAEPHSAATMPNSVGQGNTTTSEALLPKLLRQVESLQYRRAAIAHPLLTSDPRIVAVGGLSEGLPLPVLVLVAVGAFIALSKNNNQPSYTTQVVRFITPVLTDNDQLTHDISTLTPSGSISTVQSDVVVTQGATRTAQQLVTSVTVPSNDAALASQLTAALTSESAWLQAVSTVLNNTESPLLSQVSGLGLDAQSKFQDLGATLTVVRTLAVSFFNAARDVHIGEKQRWGDIASKHAVQQPGDGST